jgi:hypothetical protein
MATEWASVSVTCAESHAGVTASNDTTVTTLDLPRQDNSVSRMRVFRRMIKRVLLAVLAFAAPFCPVSAQDAKVSVDMMGIGGMSCTHWRSTQEHRLEGAVWIYGFWTGLNYVAAASDQSQAKIDVSAIVPEVEKTCALQTSQTLASAVWTTYLEFNR